METQIQADRSLRLVPPVSGPVKRGLFKAMAAPLERLLSLDKVDGIYRRLPHGVDLKEFLAEAIRSFGVNYQLSPGALQRIPEQGPLVVVCNHPFGGLEGLILAHILLSVRKDVKIMANHLLERIRELHEVFVFVDPFGNKNSPSRNVGPLKQSLTWLKSGGCLGIFPAGEVSSLKLSEGRVTDPAWSPTVARLIAKTGATVLPIFFEGANGPLFQTAGLIHPKLRTMLLPRELTNKRNKCVGVKIGNPISPKRLARLCDDSAVTEHLRLRTQLLGLSGKEKRQVRLFPLKTPQRVQSLISALDPEILAQEIAKLPESSLLSRSGEFDVILAKAEQIPLGLREIGRLRELTFRKVGEGTGSSCDIDSFDSYYLHLFLYHRERREIAGAYRLGQTDEILRRFGPRGLYTHTLFKFKPGFLDKVSPALELGRSFVAPQYQKSYAPLLLLLRGISLYVAANPRYRRLFGPVSISSDYKPVARQLMAAYFESSQFASGLTGLVRPRTPLRGSRWLNRAAANLAEDIDDLSALLADVDTAGRGVPVLLRQYLKLGGELLGFNVDPNFSNALDGFILVDLLGTERKQLEKFMGRAAVQTFVAYHEKGPGNSRKCA